MIWTTDRETQRNKGDSFPYKQSGIDDIGIAFMADTEYLPNKIC